MRVFDRSDRPVWTLFTSNWLAMAGGLLASVAGCAWLMTLPLHVQGHAPNPYIGILSFIGLPIIFGLGLVLIPIGIWMSMRAIRLGSRPPLSRNTERKRLWVFLAVATLLNIVILSQLSYSAVTFMEGAQFCGQSCHVMKPEFTAHQISPHARVPCVECHVTPGATGWVESKMAGTRQLLDVILNRYRRPIQSALETNPLVPASETCEKSHQPQHLASARLR